MAEDRRKDNKEGITLYLGAVLPEELKARTGERATTHREAIWGYDCDGTLDDGKGSEYTGDIFWDRLKCVSCEAVLKTVEGKIHWWNTHSRVGEERYNEELGKFNGEIHVYAQNKKS